MIVSKATSKRRFRHTCHRDWEHKPLGPKVSRNTQSCGACAIAELRRIFKGVSPKTKALIAKDLRADFWGRYRVGAILFGRLYVLEPERKEEAADARH
jgi:hypothetical protein